MEQDFINFYYNEFLIKKDITIDKINYCYSLYFNEVPSNNCNNCIQNRLTDISNIYTSLIKTLTPVKEKIKVKNDNKRISESL